LRNPAAEKQGKAANQSVRLLQDHSGVLWVASARDGLATVERDRNTLRYLALAPNVNSLLEPGVWAVHEDQHGVLWVGTGGHGLFSLDRDRRILRRYRHNPRNPESLSDDDVLTLFEDHEGSLWAGTAAGGTVKFPVQARPFHRYRGETDNSNGFDTVDVTSVFEDGRDVVWLGGKGVVSELDRKTGQTKVHILGATSANRSDADVLSIQEDRSGQLWFGTLGGGLTRFHPQTGRTKVYRHNPKDPNSLPHDSVF